MTLELPPISQPYPDAKPFLDVRDYLVNGWESAGAATFAIRPDGNALDFMIRVRGDNATSIIVADNIPVRPAYAVRFQGYYNGASVWLAFNNAGRLTVSTAGSYPGEIAAIVRMPMRG